MSISEYSPGHWKADSLIMKYLSTAPWMLLIFCCPDLIFGFRSCYRDKYRFYACMLRARFDENKDEKDMVKATMMLKAGEEEFWAKQHPQPYIFPDSPGGTSYERYECYKVSFSKDNSFTEDEIYFL